MTELTEAQRRERNMESWQWRCVDALRDPIKNIPSPAGAVLMEALHVSRNTIVPRVVGQGWIRADGVVLCNMWDEHGVYRVRTCVAYSVADFTNGWRVLADKLNLRDQDRVELFEKVRGWIGRDYRVSIPLSASDKVQSP